jgi:hypothetical protein
MRARSESGGTTCADALARFLDEIFKQCLPRDNLARWRDPPKTEVKVPLAPTPHFTVVGSSFVSAHRAISLVAHTGPTGFPVIQSRVGLARRCHGYGLRERAPASRLRQQADEMGHRPRREVGVAATTDARPTRRLHGSQFPHTAVGSITFSCAAIPPTPRQRPALRRSRSRSRSHARSVRAWCITA